MRTAMLLLAMVASLIVAGVAAAGDARAQNFLEDESLKCYEANVEDEERFGPGAIVVRDQFQEETYEVLQPLRFCNGAIKAPTGEFLVNGTGEAAGGLSWLDVHWVCRKIRQVGGEPFGRRRRLVSNQFGEQELIIRSANVFCSPAFKNVKGPIEPVAWKCYRAKLSQRSPALENEEFFLLDQFGFKRGDAGQPVAFCTDTDFFCNNNFGAVAGTGEDGGICKCGAGSAAGCLGLAPDLTCYRLDQTEDAAGIRLLAVDEFGFMSLSLKGADTKCVFTEKAP
jgi:hypothetical protein